MLRLLMRSLFRKNRVEAELDDELAFHLEQLTRENMARGLSGEEACYAALRAMGGVEQFKEECRDARRTGFLETLLHDLRYGARVLRRTPAFSAAAIACLALGIGSAAAMFTVINAVLLRPLPFREPDRLVGIWEETQMFGLHYSPVAMGNYTEWKAQSRSFESMGALENATYRLLGYGEPEQADGSVVSASLFRVLGVQPVRGRLFRDDEDKPGAPGAVIIGYGLWQRRFAGSPGAIGQTLLIDGRKRTIVGVMPPGFRFPNATTELWSPLGNEYDLREFSNRGRHNSMVVARLKPGVTREQANAEMRAIAAGMERTYPDTNKNVGAFVAPMREHMVGDRRLLMILLAAVGFVLLIACANVANLMLSRAVARGKEVAIRVALGAGGMRVARQLIAEHLLLAAAGGTAGTLLAYWSVGSLKHLVPGEIAALVPLELDWRVLLFVLVVTAGTCILFSLAPVARALRTDVNEALKATAGRAGRSRNSQALRRALVIAETALALVLLIGAGLMIRTFAQLRGIDPGFPTRNILTLKTPVWSRFREPADRQRYYNQVLARVTSLPGVVSAGFTLGIPLDFKGWFDGARTETMTELQSVLYRVCTPDYLRAMGIRVIKGRQFTDADNAKAPAVALVNEAMARQFWPDQDPIGRRLYQGSGDPAIVVGVVADVKQSGLDVPPKPEFYVPQRQTSTPPPALVIRTAVEPLSLASAVRREIRAVDREMPIIAVQTMEEILDREVFQRRFQMLILAFFAGGALLLASVGIYGVLSYLVAQRRHEIGLRMALGAASSDILKNVFGQAAALMAAGLAIGLAASLALTRMMSHLLVGVTATDPATFIGVPLVLFAVGLAASYIPARRAMKVDPSLTLRDE